MGIMDRFAAHMGTLMGRLTSSCVPVDRDLGVHSANKYVYILSSVFVLLFFLIFKLCSNCETRACLTLKESCPLPFLRLLLLLLPLTEYLPRCVLHLHQRHSHHHQFTRHRRPTIQYKLFIYFFQLFFGWGKRDSFTMHCERDLEKMAKGWQIAMSYSEKRLKKLNAWEDYELEEAVRGGKVVLETVCLFVHACVKHGQYQYVDSFSPLLRFIFIFSLSHISCLLLLPFPHACFLSFC